MTIKYLDGRTSEAVLLFRANHTMRVALQGGDDDATDLAHVIGAWFPENLEPSPPEFAWQSRFHSAAPPVSDCVCSSELASTLVDLLFTRDR
jgi:hypothetical protein